MENLENKLKKIRNILGEEDLIATILIKNKGLEVVSISKRDRTFIDTDTKSVIDDNSEEISDIDINEIKNHEDSSNYTQYIG